MAGEMGQNGATAGRVVTWLIGALPRTPGYFGIKETVRGAQVWEMSDDLS